MSVLRRWNVRRCCGRCADRCCRRCPTALAAAAHVVLIVVVSDCLCCSSSSCSFRIVQFIVFGVVAVAVVTANFVERLVNLGASPANVWCVSGNFLV